MTDSAISSHVDRGGESSSVGESMAESSGPRGRQSSARRRRIDLQGYVLVAPAILITAVLLLYPAARSIVDSLRNNDLTSPDRSFSGFENYARVLGDSDFQKSIFNTVGYLIIASICALVLGLVIALWLQSLRRLRMVALTLVLLPWAVPGTVAGALWSLIFSGTGSGLVNSVLMSLGIIETNQAWFVQPYIGLVFLALSFVWGLVPVAVILLLAALESIPKQLREAASVDGASGVKGFFSITLPLLRPAIAIVLVNAGVQSIGLFDQIFVLVGTDPDRMTIIGQVYLYAFRDFNLGYALAASVLATIATLIISVFYLRFVYREVSYA